MRHALEVLAGGPDDPDGTRAGAVLSAYFRVEQVQGFCRLLWSPLAALGIAWVLFAALVPGISRAALGVGLAMFCAVALGAIVLERRAVKTLNRLAGALPHSLATHSTASSVARKAASS